MEVYICPKKLTDKKINFGESNGKINLGKY
jgi:hypothetical protein